MILDRLKFYVIECFNETEPEKKDEEKDGTDNEESKEREVDENEEKETSKKGKSKEKKTQGEGKDKKKNVKKSSKQTGKVFPELRRRLRQNSAEEQKENRRNRQREFVGGKMDEPKRRELQMRLREIHDVDRLRRDLWKIRQREMTEDDYTPIEP